MRGTTTRRILIASLSVLAAALSGASMASAAAPWLAATPLAEGNQYIAQPTIRFGPDGTAYVTWVVSDGTNTVVQVASRPPGGSFGAATPVSPDTGSATGPALAVDRQGDVTVAWVRNGVVESRYLPAGGGWGAVETLSDSTGSASAPSLAVGDRGNAIAVWSNFSASPNRVEAAIRPEGSPVFAGRNFVSPNAGSSLYGTPRSAMDAAGDAIVLWQQYIDVGGGTMRWVMRTNERAAGSGFDPNATVNRSPTGAGGAGSAQYWVRMAPNGRAMAMWDYSDGGTSPGSQYVQYIDRTVGSSFGAGTWSGTARASSASQNAFDPSVALDDAGDAIAAWSIFDGTNYVLQGATRAGFGGFGNLTPLSSTGGSVFASALGSSPGGFAVTNWNGTAGSDPAIFGAYRRPGAAFGNTDVVYSVHPAAGTSVSLGVPDVAVDGEGNALTVVPQTSSDSTGLHYRLLAIGFDPVAPSIGAVSVPASAVVGQGAGMSVQVSDRGGARVAWSFGDGTSGTGASVTHAYGAAGTYTVGVTATDGAGNQASQSRTIQVSDPAAAAGGGGTSGGGGATTTPPVPGMAAAKPAARWKIAGASFTLTRLTISKLAKGWRVKALCTGKHCPFKSRALKNKKVKAGTLNALKAMGKRHTFRAGQTLELRISAPGASTRVVRYAFKKGRRPKAATLCLAPGARKPTRTCA